MPHPFQPCQDPLACTSVATSLCHFPTSEQHDCQLPAEDPVHSTTADRPLTKDEVLSYLGLTQSSNGAPSFPTFSVCPRCHGTTSMYSHRFGSVQNRTGAHQLRLIQYGYYLAKWEGLNVGNSYIVPTACDCACDHQWEEVNLPARPMFDHLTRCAKCGENVRYDSSD